MQDKEAHESSARKGIAPRASVDAGASFTARDVLRAAANLAGVRTARLVGSSSSSLVRLRVAVAVVMRTRLGLSLPEIGEQLCRDHSTVLKQLQRLADDEDVQALVARLNAALEPAVAEPAA